MLLFFTQPICGHIYSQAKIVAFGKAKKQVIIEEMEVTVAKESKNVY